MGRTTKSVVALGLATLTAVSIGAPLHAQSDQEPVGEISEATGEVSICASEADCRPAETGDRISEGTSIRTERSSGRVTIYRLIERETDFERHHGEPFTIILDENTEIRFIPKDPRPEPVPTSTAVIELIRGWIQGFPGRWERRGRMFSHKAGVTGCGARGTEYAIGHDVGSGITTVAVGEGAMVCETPAGERTVSAMEQMTVSPRGEVSVDAMSAGEWVRLEAKILGDLGDPGTIGSFDGSWSSTYGKRLKLTQSGDRVIGTYDVPDNGQVVFTITGERTLDGFWIEDHSSTECASAKEGRKFWGRLILDFDEAFSKYRGSWGYCDAEPHAGWFGTRAAR